MDNASKAELDERVCAVIVAFNPEEDHLGQLLRECLDQCDGVVLVNNGSSLALELQHQNRLHTINMVENIGLAAAQNLGVGWAACQQFDFVWFLDQDSWPESGLVISLRRAFAELDSYGDLPAAVGPYLLDHRDGIVVPFVRFHAWGIKRIYLDPSLSHIKCDFLISSGLFTSINRFQAIGPWEEGLFIDNVDLEWCFRARSRGYYCYGVNQARLSHTLGESLVRIRFMRGHIPIYFHSPVRHYYMMRNRIALYRRGYVPLSWKIQDLPRALLKTLLFGLVYGPRLRNLKFTFRGIWDGLRGRLGPLPEQPMLSEASEQPGQAHGDNG
jgi:rhamnosyltransferase